MAKQAKLLIVDDEEAVRHFLLKVLQHDGHAVEAVESGEAALKLIAQQEFDLALIDLKLKDMNGMDIVAALKQSSPATSTVVLTAHGSLESAVEALRQGAHDYLFKPCPTPDLRESVRTGLLKRERALAQRPPAEMPATDLAGARGQGVRQEDGRTGRAKGFTIDPISHMVTLDGQPLNLSPTEFDLLAYLARQAPRVVPATELMREVQGYEGDTMEARDLVRSHIYHLRAKIKAISGQDLIRTVRGIGYALHQ